MVIIEVGRYGVTTRFEYETIQEAAEEALMDLETDQSFPQRIIDNGEVVWEFSDINTFRAELEKLKSA